MSPTAQLLETAFTVMDEIRMNPAWSARYPGYAGISDGILLLLDPPSSATEEEIESASAMATMPDGSEKELEFHKAIVNKAGCIGLYFAKEKSEIVPKGSTVRFKESEMPDPPAESEDGYVLQGQFDIPEANKILPRLEKEGIRFQIDTDLMPHVEVETSYYDGRI
ncbi:MAG TPA: hypothetical protein VHY22_05785, partial [Chthoniobacteraceae bacterium]|nr:hypothetical protein [Chthoniobacteraceae bacterium]